MSLSALTGSQLQTRCTCLVEWVARPLCADSLRATAAVFALATNLARSGEGDNTAQFADVPKDVH
eukprot:1672862-Amphidinium_carterae.2